MKSTKSILFALAGIWTTLLIFDKILNTTSSVKLKTFSKPLQLIYFSTRFIKSILFFCLIIVNVFMAISLIEHKK